MAGEFYRLTPEQVKAYEKETLKDLSYRRYGGSLFQMVSEAFRDGASGTEDDICGIVDRLISSVADVIVRPWKYRENFIPSTKEYPQMVYRELAERVEGLKVVFHEQPYDDELIVSMTLRNNIWHIADGFKDWYDIRWDAHPLYSYYQFAMNIISCGWGNDACCLRPDLAAEIFLMLDDMTAYLREEVRELAYKVRQEMLCRQVDMNSVLAAVKEAGFKYYRLWVNSTRTIALHVKLSGNREVDVTLYPRQINEKLDVLIEDLKAAERGEPTVLRCRIYDAVGKWDVIQ
jgi:hypothetical protein